MPLAPLIVGWLIGIFAADLLHPPLIPVVAGAVTCFALAWLWRRTPSVTRPVLVIGCLLLGGARLLQTEAAATDHTIIRLLGQTVVLHGSATGQPDRREDRQIATIRVTAIDLRGTLQPATGVVEVQLPPLPQLAYGQVVTLRGIVAAPKLSARFDRRSYLQRHHVDAVIDKPAVTLLPGFGGVALLRPLSELNNRLQDLVLRLLPEPHASLLNTILLGHMSTLPRAVNADFSATGTAHILVVSGYNVTVLIALVLALAWRLGLSRAAAAWLALALLAAFVVLVGGSPSAVRSAAMAALLLFAERVGRPAERWTLLLLATLVLSIADPYVLWDLGFQLSALATAGLFALSTPLTGLLSRGPLSPTWHAMIVEPLVATVSATAATLPLMLVHFGQLPLIAPLANLLLLPVVPLAMGLGIVAIIAGAIALPLGQLFGLLTWPLLEWLVRGSHLLATIPGATLSVAGLDPAWMWGYYGVAMLLWFAIRRNRARPRFVATP